MKKKRERVLRRAALLDQTKRAKQIYLANEASAGTVSFGCLPDKRKNGRKSTGEQLALRAYI